MIDSVLDSKNVVPVFLAQSVISPFEILNIFEKTFAAYPVIELNRKFGRIFFDDGVEVSEYWSVVIVIQICVYLF